MRSRLANIALRLCDSLLTSAVRPQEPKATDYLRLTLSRSTRHFDRPAAALNFLNALIPGARALWVRLVVRVSRLPFRSVDVAPLAHGNGTTVYAFEGPTGPFVYKVQRASLGLSMSDLAAFAKDRLQGFEGVLRHYGTARDVFPPTHFLIAHGPLLGAPAVVTLQPMLTGPSRDFLHDFDDDEIARLLERQPELRRQVAAFAERTVAAWDGGARWIVDLGNDNLLVGGPPHDLRLIYVDAEMLEVSVLKSSSRNALYEGLVARMRTWQSWLGDSIPAGRRALGEEAP